MNSHTSFMFLRSAGFVALFASLFTTSLTREEAPKPAPNIGAFKSRATSTFDTIRTDLNSYSWPTDASRKVTSSFAEYRSTHFHGGIDISTNGHTGYKVLAARDGYVYRVRITPNGYGKMLFIKHPDGYVTAYAHLQTFNDAINGAVREEQYRRGTYSIDLTFDSPRIRVKQGEIVAYTGDTGFGPPHLHFELRDENLNPVNPMLSENFTVKDDIRPSIKRLMIAPLTPSSTVDGGFKTRFFSRLPRNRNTVKIRQLIHVQGEIGFAVEAMDRSDGTWSKAGIHRMELYLDDSLAFAMTLDRVPAEETKLIDLHYDFPTIRHGWGKFQKLYLDIGNTLPFYENRPEQSGVINTGRLPEGEHAYRIVCKDISGNQTELQGRLLVSRKPAISIVNAGANEVSISGTHLDAISKFYIFGKQLSEPGWSQHTLTKGRFGVNDHGITLPVDMKQYDLLKIIAETAHGIRSAPVFYFTKKPSASSRTIDIKTDIYNNFVRVWVSTNGMFTAAPHCVVEEGLARHSIFMEAVEANNYFGILVPSDPYAGTRTVHVDVEVNGRIGSSSESIELYSIPTSRSGSFTYDAGKLTVSYDSGAVFRPLHMRVAKEPSRHTTLYTLEPEDVLLNRGIRVSLPYPPEAKDNHYGLYFRSTAGWIFQTMKPDSGRNSISTLLTRTLGEVALMQDDEPPHIGRVRIFPHGRRPNIGFSYYDNLSGVDPDEIKMYIDNTMVIPEIDGEHHRVWYQADQRLDRGRHSLRISVKDRMKNETQFSRSFSLK